jgi:3-oxoacyl-[acyl-carrier protein] reductase
MSEHLERKKTMDFMDMNVIVTGASRGIGSGIAIGFGREKASVVVNYVSNKDAAEEIVTEIEELGGKAFSFKTDTSDPGQVQGMVDAANQRFGDIHVLVNNAGISGPYAHLVDTTVEEWDRVMAINLRGYFLCCKAVLPSMLERKTGSIVNISSIYGKRGEENNAAYCATKAGEILLTQTLALEVAPHIRVNAVCPGHMATEQNWDEIRTWAEERGTTFEYERDKLWDSIPMKRNGENEDVANLVLFLASDASTYITGQAIDVDGGFRLG